MYLFVSLLLGLSSLCGAVQWKTDYQGALKESEATGKPVVLFFTGSDWCGWCKKLVGEAFNTPEFSQSAGDSFIFVELDYPRTVKQDPALSAQNTSLKAKYGINGYPSVILINGKESILGRTGYQAGGGKAYADHLKSFVPAANR